MAVSSDWGAGRQGSYTGLRSGSVLYVYTSRPSDVLLHLRHYELVVSGYYWTDAAKS